ncbi:uncharacterized protein LOC132757672 [Ruditapes philippinarum]|uniref:uncharacterized protein LOC132757672 n=1 Tax=Ruditapes philippinarum TaxID=129788 RepID=UPI00295B9290|nr:uncharacterized protein LOC132757672 [Ruditapes philippinarum]
MAESKDFSNSNELILLHEKLRDLQHQNEALKLQNEISILERQIDSMQLSFQNQYDSNYEDKQTSTPKCLTRQYATPLSERRRRLLPPTPDKKPFKIESVLTPLAEKQRFTESPCGSDLNYPRDRFVTFRKRKSKPANKTESLHSNIQMDTSNSTEIKRDPKNSNSKRSVMMKPATYDGTSSWIDYKAHFEACSEINQWTNKEKGLYLSVSLRGQAQGVFGNLTSKSPNYDELVLALEERFSPPNQTELYRTQLRERRQKASESLSDMRQDIRRLTNLAYPSAPSNVKETLAKEQFIDSLVNSDMRLRNKQARPTSLNEAVRHAVELEAFNRAERKSHENHGYMRKLNSGEYDSPKNQDDKLDSLTKLVEEIKNMLSMFRRQNNYQTVDKRNRNTSKQNQNNRTSSRTFANGPNTNSLHCNECGQKGHNKYNCRKFSGRSKRKIYVLEKDCENSSNSCGSGLFVEATINGIKANCLIDTGALSMISSSFIE